MISPQEPAGNEYYYPTRGTSRVSVTHPASAYAYWRRRIGEEISFLIEKACDHEMSRPCRYCINAAILARGEQ